MKKIIVVLSFLAALFKGQTAEQKAAEKAKLAELRAKAVAGDQVAVRELMFLRATATILKPCTAKAGSEDCPAGSDAAYGTAHPY